MTLDVQMNCQYDPMVIHEQNDDSEQQRRCFVPNREIGQDGIQQKTPLIDLPVRLFEESSHSSACFGSVKVTDIQPHQ
jgi:hypothetical protein